jgi:hypothetical protein
MFVEDSWLDAFATEAAAPSLCKSLSECGWNRSVGVYADIASSKRSLFLLADLSSESSDLATGVAREDVQAKADDDQRSLEQERSREIEETRLALETQAVRLSLLLGQSCTETGPRQCWRSATPAARTGGTDTKELRPVTVTFSGEPRSHRAAYDNTQNSKARLVTSLKQFRLASL